MEYKTEGGRYYRISTKKGVSNSTNKATVSRISCAEYDDPTKNKNIGRTMPKLKDTVIIIIKPYQQFNCKKGTITEIYTKKLIHTRGHKVKINSGEVGRVLKIL
jgi:uncharacterized repeat protein (TIGR03833 family)